MKLRHLFLCGAVIFFMASCSSDDDSGTAVPSETNTNFLPLNVGMHWTYHNTMTITGQFNNESNETITVADSTTAAETTSYEFSSDIGLQDQGVMTALLTNGVINKVNGKIVYNGNLSLQIPGISDSLSIPIDNLLLLNQNANSGQNLSTITNSITQNINISGLSLPLDVDYTLTSTAGDVFDSYSNGNQSYDNVISANLSLEITVSINAMGFNIQLLVNQKALDVDNFYAENVGLILSQNTINLHFEDLSDLPIPGLPDLDSIEGSSSQVLQDYAL